MIQAITFDFWDTIAIDDSDEPKRAALGLPSKAEARIELFARQVTEHHPRVSYPEAAAAYQWSNQRFRKDWREDFRTPAVISRVRYAYEYLGLEPEPGRYATLVREVDELVRDIENMEVRIPPDFAPGIHQAIATLARSYTLGIISDTIHTHGRGLRHLLAQQGLLDYFSHFIFSDEVGASKPSTQVFRHAMNSLELGASQIAHIGDRESNDVAGPLSVGMRAVLFTGIIDRGSGQTRAHAVCRRYADLPAIIRRLP